MRFTVKDGAVMVNDANVVKVIEGPSWSIFVIDKVLQPPQLRDAGGLGVGVCAAGGVTRRPPRSEGGAASPGPPASAAA